MQKLRKKQCTKTYFTPIFSMTCIRLSSKPPSEMGHHVLQWKSSDQNAHYSKNFHTMNNILQKTSVKHLLHAE